jgi:Peptidase family M28
MLEKGFGKNKISIGTEPAEKKQLFQRSDNYPFALKGIPYHTIMASDDDDDCYHKPCDEVRRIDIANMTRIIKAIVASVKPLINGELTPKRINPSVVEIKEKM